MTTQFNCQKDFCFKLYTFVKQFYFKQFGLVQVQFFLHTQLIVKAVLFLAIQISSRVLFDPEIGLYQVLPLRTKVYLGVIVIKGYSEFPNLTIRLFCVITRHSFAEWGGSYPSAEKHLVFPKPQPTGQSTIRFHIAKWLLFVGFTWFKVISNIVKYKSENTTSHI